MTPRAAEVRFYFDADIRGLGMVVGSLRSDVTYPGDPGALIHRRQRPPCPISSPNVPDAYWIPEVARRGWLIVTRDSRIAENRNQIAAIREHNARMVAISQQGVPTAWRQLEVLMSQWRNIEAMAARPGPFLWRVSRTAMTEILLVSD